jgi:hypothetical protein
MERFDYAAVLEHDARTKARRIFPLLSREAEK